MHKQVVCRVKGYDWMRLGEELQYCQTSLTSEGTALLGLGTQVGPPVAWSPTELLTLLCGIMALGEESTWMTSHKTQEQEGGSCELLPRLDYGEGI
jgi:hypothetical protein